MRKEFYPIIKPKLLQSIANSYTEPLRVITEFIDNSIDSADEEYFNSENNCYSKKIEIKIKIQKIKRNKKIIISDNSVGMDEKKLENIFTNIGDSHKQGQAKTVGQFGFGIHSFSSICDKLTMVSKIKNSVPHEVSISKGFYDLKNEKLTLKKSNINLEYSSGTVVILEDFENDIVKKLNSKDLKEHIENHIPPVLDRAFLTVSIIDENKSEEICKPYDFMKKRYPDEIPIKYTYDKLEYNKKGGATVLVPINGKQPLTVNLKITPQDHLNHPPIIIIKGRKIDEISGIKSFKSKEKQKIWNNPTLTGFIDCGDLDINPSITRDNIAKSHQSQALFSLFREIEDLVNDEIKKINENKSSELYREVENQLNKALKDLINFNNSQIRERIEIEKHGKDKFGGVGEGDFDEGFIKTNPEPDPVPKPDPNPDPSPNPKPKPKPIGEGNEEGINVFGDEDDFFGNKKKTTGLNIQLIDRECPISEATGEEVRSSISGNTILIYTKHKDFINRTKTQRNAQEKISSKLITYLSCEINIHYWDIHYNKHGHPPNAKDTFVDFTTGIYRFEESLKELQNKTLQDFKKNE